MNLKNQPALTFNFDIIMDTHWARWYRCILFQSWMPHRKCPRRNSYTWTWILGYCLLHRYLIGFIQNYNEFQTNSFQFPRVSSTTCRISWTTSTTSNINEFRVQFYSGRIVDVWARRLISFGSLPKLLNGLATDTDADTIHPRWNQMANRNFHFSSHY